jgi:hypothetical protein
VPADKGNKSEMIDNARHPFCALANTSQCRDSLALTVIWKINLRERDNDANSDVPKRHFTDSKPHLDGETILSALEFQTT